MHPRLLLVYHFFHPDEVVSARQFTDLALEQRARGFDVTALTSDRLWAKPDARLPAEETWHGIRIVRVHRPAWRQSRPQERLANSAWMLGAWLARARMLGRFDAVVVGSDPAFAPLLAVGLRAMWPRATLAHWCFDLYPEAIVAEGLGGPVVRALVPVAKRLMARAYAACDHVVDLGPRMRERLDAYGAPAQQSTLVPWPLVEASPPSDAARVARVRRELFGDEARLGLLYSGTLGRAHDFETLLDLARACRARSGRSVAFSFACRGAREAELRTALRSDDANISLAGFCAEEDLAARLGAADVHLISLREGWSGVVVPSKFFGSLSLGKPVLYAGARDSDLARWIDRYDVGLCVERASVDATADTIHRLLDEPEALQRWRSKALAAYAVHFSKAAVNDAWAALLGAPRGHRAKAERVASCAS